MKSIQDLIFDRITNSAKTRFDYKKFESDFEGLPHHVAENFLFAIIAGFATGKDEKEISLKLFNDILMMGFIFEKNQLEEFLIDKKKLLSKEIFVMQTSLGMLDDNSDEIAVLNFVNQLL